MNKAEFVEAVSARLDGDKKAAAAAVESVIQTIYQNVAKGERIAITGFGVFEKRVRAARTARNPATGEKVRVKKTSVPAFRAAAPAILSPSGAGSRSRRDRRDWRRRSAADASRGMRR